MNISHHSTDHLKWHNRLFIILFLILMGLLAFLSTRYVYLADWTVNNQNSLNEISLQVLQTLDAPIEVISYTNNQRIKQSVRELLQRYQRIKADIHLSFINPDSDPEKIRALNITVDGEMVIRYQGRQENLAHLSEQDITNSLHRLLRTKERKIFFTQGHGERSHEQQANFDLKDFSLHLIKQGFLLESINLARKKNIPEDSAVLVIAGPQAAFLASEVQLIIDYVRAGGHLLWLADPLKVSSNHAMHGLLPLAEYLGIEFLDGVIVDPTTQQYDIERPDYAVVSEYPEHTINNDFSSITLFPQAAAIERLPGFLHDKEAFEMKAFLMTSEQSWVETSALQETIHFSDLLDIIGPLTIGVTLSRSMSKNKEQRIVIMGDGDFLSNTFLGNAGNLELALNIFNWLSHDEQLINIPTRIKDDIILDLSETQLSLLGSFFLFVLPGLLALSASLIWLKRRNH